MTEELWGKKPKPDHVWSNGIYRRSYYSVSRMDAWLEKVRTDYDKLSETLDDARYEWSKDILAYHELRDKLEAVKTHLTKWVSGHSDWQDGSMTKWKKELEKILEDEA